LPVAVPSHAPALDWFEEIDTRGLGFATVVTVEPRGENDPDIYLVVNYKNWAALDGATAKTDQILKQVEGSLATSNKGAVDRGKIRRVVGSWTGQELDLK
jgi:hypothetical protein